MRSGCACGVWASWASYWSRAQSRPSSYWISSVPIAMGRRIPVRHRHVVRHGLALTRAVRADFHPPNGRALSPAPTPRRGLTEDNHYAGSVDGSIAPSQSASQVARRTAGYPASQQSEEDDAIDVHVPAPHRIPTAAHDLQIPYGTLGAPRARRASAPPQQQPQGSGYASNVAKKVFPSMKEPAANEAAPAPDPDSSDDERRAKQEFVAHRGGGADWGKRRSTRQEASSDLGEEVLDRRRANRSSTGSFFGGFFSLFRRRPRDDDDDDRGSVVSAGNKWTTRTDVNLHVAKRPILGRRNSSDDDEGRPDPKTLVRVVNRRSAPVGPSSESGMKRHHSVEIHNPPGHPLERRRVASEAGAPTTTTAPVRASTLKKKPKAADGSVTTTPAVSSPLARSTSSATANTITTIGTSGTNGTVKRKKKKVKAPPLPGTNETPAPGSVVIKPPAQANGKSAQSLMSLVSDQALPDSPVKSAMKPSRKYSVKGAAAADSMPNGDVPKPNGILAPSAKAAPLPESHMVLPSQLMPKPKADAVLPPSHMHLPMAPPRLALDGSDVAAPAPTTSRLTVQSATETSPVRSVDTATPSRRKSVRMAEGSMKGDVVYTNTPPPSEPRSPSPNPQALAPALKQTASSGASAREAASPTPGWAIRSPRAGDESSDDEEETEYQKVPWCEDGTLPLC